jgi:hypothetical protein
MDTRRISIRKYMVMGKSKVVLEDGLLQPIPEEVEAELDKVLDEADID